MKAIFFDIDGTLISTKHPRIKPEVIEALQKLRQRGIMLFIASGRHMLEIEELKIEDDFQFDGYLLLNGGCCICQGKVIYENCIDEHDVKAMCKVIDDKHIPALFIEKDDMYINFINEDVQTAQDSIHTIIPKISKEIHYHHIVQLDPYIKGEGIDDIMSVTKNCKCTRWHELAYDIIPIQSGKKAGVEAILNYCKFDKKDVMAFGDGENDIEMFEAVGISVAMKNANEHVKSYANYTCGDVDEDGILVTLEQFGLV